MMPQAVRQGHGNVPQFEEIGVQMLPFYPGIAAMGLGKADRFSIIFD